MNPPSTPSEANREDFSYVVAALEPDQLIASKQRVHCPHRDLTLFEKTLFWGLRVYLVFMFGVVIYQIWHSVR